MHAHWLPGIDDGPGTLEESMAMLHKFHAMGYKKLIATPHIYRDYYPNTSESIQAAFEKVKEKALIQLPDLKLYFAAEYYLDEYFSILIKKKELLYFQENHVLVEQGFFSEIPGLDRFIFDLQIAGYVPVMAHPERYGYYHIREDRIVSLRHAGVKMQVNLLGLAGKYGAPISKKAEEWIKKDLIDFIGTDAHSVSDLDLLDPISWSADIAEKFIRNGLQEG
ncbi:MAG TPA: CpsB/CapC family capsule biosynthesis tyrosine phosphatase [Chitinophagaceae bacterium]|nr:CpsB/CapC family capsule biosynthesis tyrosine phosphatase [Chitinophagaceae bacterium]